MPRFLPALIVLAGLFLLLDPARARGYSAADPPRSAQERRRELGELLVIGIVAGGIGTVAVVQGIREFLACLPRARQAIYLDDDSD